MNILYETDIVLWSQQHSDLPRRRATGNLGNELELDWLNLAEEIESLGRAEQEQLTTRLGVLLAYLLKWRFQTERRGNSWRLTILDQQRRRVLESSFEAQAYGRASKTFSRRVMATPCSSPHERPSFPRRLSHLFVRGLSRKP